MRNLTNARAEFLANVGDVLTVKCASIGEEEDSYRLEVGQKAKRILLRMNYTEEEYTNFLHALNFDYDAGYGGQNLFGNIWFTDGSWYERGEYDGSEWWEHKKVPVIPEELAPTFDNGPDVIAIQ